MSLCYICGTELAEEAECPKCRYSVQVLRMIDKTILRQRFLFGASKPDQHSGPVAREKTEPRARRRKPEPPRNFAEDPIHEDVEPVYDLIEARDAVFPTQLEPEKTASGRFLIHFLDVLLCSLLVAFVLGLLLFVSQRNLVELFTFSLIPMIFVGAGFAAVYFITFVSTLHKTLAELILDRFKNEEA